MRADSSIKGILSPVPDVKSNSYRPKAEMASKRSSYTQYRKDFIKKPFPVEYYPLLDRHVQSDTYDDDQLSNIFLGWGTGRTPFPNSLR